MREQNIILGDTDPELGNPVVHAIRARIDDWLSGKNFISFPTSQELRDAIGAGEENPFVEPVDLSNVDTVTLVGSELDLCVVDAVSALLRSGIAVMTVLPDLTASKEDYTGVNRPSNDVLLERFGRVLKTKLAKDRLRAAHLVVESDQEAWHFSMGQ